MPKARVSSFSAEKAWLLERGYRLGKEIGRGSNGRVFSGVCLDSGAEVAVKMVKTVGMGQQDRRRLRREIQLLKGMHHDNLLDYVTAFENERHVFIVTELMKEDLFDRTSRTPLSEDEALKVARQVLCALKFLHSRGIAHRDIKLENIMLAEGDDLSVKLVDFGAALINQVDGVHSANRSDSGDGFGTTYYLPPEVVEERTYIPSVADTWAVGVVMYSAITGHFPFYGDSPEEAHDMIVHAQPRFREAEWELVSKETKEFVRLLLVKDKLVRPDASQALRILHEIAIDRADSSRYSRRKSNLLGGFLSRRGQRHIDSSS